MADPNPVQHLWNKKYSDQTVKQISVWVDATLYFKILYKCETISHYDPAQLIYVCVSLYQNCLHGACCGEFQCGLSK